MARCLLISKLADEFIEETRRLGASEINLTAAATVEEALDAYDGHTVLFGNPDLISESLSRMPGVQWVQSTWAGVTPLLENPRRDYLLTGVKDVFGPQMSEYVIGYLLAHELKILARKEAQTQRLWFNDLSGNLAGKRLGIMGTGSIGQAIAKSAKRLGMQVSGLSRSGKTCEGFDQVYTIERLDAFLKSSDHLVSVLPDTPETTGLLSVDSLKNLPADAFFVNVGRSNVIDDEALIDALQNSGIAGAALDVFDEEPIPADSPLWDTPNLHVTAHIAAVSHPRLIVPIFVENYRRFVAGRTLRHLIDFEKGY